MGRRLVEDCLTLDLAWIMRLAPIQAGQAGSGEMKWSRDGEAVASAQFGLDLRDAGAATITLQYDLRLANGLPHKILQIIRLTQTRLNFGGLRWWMRCPVTGERARTLHLPPGGDRFASRKAWGLAYRVERLNRFDRSFEKLFRAQRKLGNAQGLGSGLEKPQGMWRRSFVRHAERFETLDLNCAEKIVAMIEQA